MHGRLEFAIIGGGGGWLIVCLNAHRISKRSQVLVPSPQGDLRVVMPRILVGMRTGPRTFRCFSLAPRIRSADTAMTHTLRQSVCQRCGDKESAAVFPAAFAKGDKASKTLAGIGTALDVLACGCCALLQIMT